MAASISTRRIRKERGAPSARCGPRPKVLPTKPLAQPWQSRKTWQPSVRLTGTSPKTSRKGWCSPSARPSTKDAQRHSLCGASLIAEFEDSLSAGTTERLGGGLPVVQIGQRSTNRVGSDGALGGGAELEPIAQSETSRSMARGMPDTARDEPMGQRVNAAPVAGQGVDELVLTETAEDLHFELTVAPVHLLPRGERTLGMVKASRLGVETKLQPALVHAASEFDVLGAQESSIEATSSEHVGFRNRGVARPKLTERRLPIAAQHGCVLRLELRLLPSDPGLRIVR